MKHLTLALALLSSSAFAECTLARTAIDRGLRKVPGVTQFSSSKITGSSERGWARKESLTMASGLKISYNVGGCEHFGYSYTYEKMGPQPVGTKAQVLGLAKRLLTSTPASGDDKLIPLLNCIDSVAPQSELENGLLFSAAGDANCTFDVSVRGKLKVSYDFAL